ncbi:radical SAM protein [Streptomyces spectabilis]|uniref:radical SAM protein n=1 Tax=Streptomyces spectabilis TaxID=68270 RepID=UPI0033C154CF
MTTPASSFESTTAGQKEELWGSYFLYRLSGGSAALFDPVSLESVYLDPSEVRRLHADDNSLAADLRTYGFHRTVQAPNRREAVVNRAGTELAGSPTHMSGYRIVVTDKCNMKCSYCFVDTNTSNPDMSQKDLHEGLDLLLTTNKNRKRISIQWFGGEPTIRFDLMKWGDTYARRLAQDYGIEKVTPVVVTNGVLLTDEMLDHYKEFGYGVGVSIDGPASAERTLLSGKPADPRIHRNITRMIEAGVDVGANLTPTPHNVGQMVKVIGYLMDLGLRFIYVNTPIPISGKWHVPGSTLAKALFEARLYAVGRGGMVFSRLDRIYQGIDTREPRIYEHMQRDGGVRVALLPGRRISVLDLNWRDQEFIYAIDDIRSDPGLLNQACKPLFPSPQCETCPALAVCGGPSQNDRALRRTGQPDPEFCAFHEQALALALSDNTGLQ